jgi:hypothetical protein
MLSSGFRGPVLTGGAGIAQDSPTRLDGLDVRSWGRPLYFFQSGRPTVLGRDRGCENRSTAFADIEVGRYLTAIGDTVEPEPP